MTAPLCSRCDKPCGCVQPAAGPWIPCAEGLPQLHAQVLVRNTHGVTVGHLGRDDSVSLNGRRWFFDSDRSGDHWSTATHWAEIHRPESLNETKEQQ